MNTEIFESIVTGFKNYTFKSETVEELATVRAKICAECPHANPKYKFKLFKDKANKEIEGLGCNICGCLLSAKVRSPLESCPDNPKRWE